MKISFNEFYANEEYKNNRNYLKVCINRVYYSNWAKLLRSYMELSEFENEVHMRNIKYWCYDTTICSLNTYLTKIVYATISKINQDMGRIKRKINYIQNESIEESFEDDTKEDIELGYYDDYFNKQKCIDYITNDITDNTDKSIIELYLHEYSMTDISKIVDIPYKQVVYKIKTKYQLLMKSKYLQYANSI